MTAFYNEIDPFCADFLEELIKQGLTANGIVDRRSIAEISPDEVAGFTQVHWFAGVGGWSLALRLAGWPDDRPIWTGSCPCQPFSEAGKQQGISDERHLWPVMFRHIQAIRPQVVIGEQVASSEVVGTQLEADFAVAVQRGDFAKANKLAKRLVAGSSFSFTRRWVDGIRSDLEAEDYAFRSIVLGAHSVKSPHIRQRLWWVADSRLAERGRWYSAGGRSGEPLHVANGGVTDGGLADTGQQPPRERRSGEGTPENAESSERRSEVFHEPGRCGADHGLVDSTNAGLEGHTGHVHNRSESGRDGKVENGPAPTAGAWSDYRIVHCLDGKARRVGRGVFPLVNGIPRDMGSGKPGLRSVVRRARSNRVGRLKAYGNAIVPQVAAEFVRAVMDIQENG